MQDFDRPPLSSNFPGLTLLHAILAVAFTISPPNVLNISKEPYWQTSGVELPAFYHAERTKFWMDRDVENIQRVFEFAQALCLLCHFSWSHARFQELWLYTGLYTSTSARMTIKHNYERQEWQLELALHSV